MIHFGYPFRPEAIVGWAARAIFDTRSTTHPLDILPDRQTWKIPEHYSEEERNAVVKAFCHTLDRVILPVLNRVAQNYSPRSSDKFCCTFDHPKDKNIVFLCEGSPNASYGYFYVAVNLMKRSDLAPSD